MITVAQAQAALNTWWEGARNPRASAISARLARAWNQADAGYVRVDVVDGADGLGTAIRIELERLDGGMVVRELRPATANAFGFELDDLEHLNVTRRPRTRVVDEGAGQERGR